MFLDEIDTYDCLIPGTLLFYLCDGQSIWLLLMLFGPWEPVKSRDRSVDWLVGWAPAFFSLSFLISAWCFAFRRLRSSRTCWSRRISSCSARYLSASTLRRLSSICLRSSFWFSLSYLYLMSPSSPALFDGYKPIIWSTFKDPKLPTLP